MKIIGVIANTGKDKGLKYTRRVVDRIKSLNGNYNIKSEIAVRLGLTSSNPNDDDVINKSDIIVSLGGDGTFLNVARKAYAKNKPILGINLGTLGFLTEIDKKEMDTAIERLLKNGYAIEERMMLYAEVLRDGMIIASDVALNDIVISRIALSRILHIKTYINGIFVDSFPGDGLIVSSPTGSTAYSLSAGGPIVEPDLDIIMVTPICPHILHSRSIITKSGRVVEVVIDENYQHNAMLTVDGQEGVKVKSGDMIRIKKAACSVKIIKFDKREFFNVLRSKIYYRGGNYNEV